jgi:DNA-binding response OmpR family regulator
MCRRSNGLEVCQNLRQQHVDIPIIAATANYSLSEAALYTAAGFDCVLQKPFSVSEMQAAIATALDKRGKASASDAAPF